MKKTNENNDIPETINTDSDIPKSTSKKYKTETCNVLAYNKKTKELDIDFKGYGVRLNNVENIISDTVLIKYLGQIGKSNFQCKL